MFNTIRVVLSLFETPSNQEMAENEEDESENNEELEEPQQVNGHFWDSLVKEYENKSPPTGQHAYNTRSRAFTNNPGASSLLQILTTITHNLINKLSPVNRLNQPKLPNLFKMLQN